MHNWRRQVPKDKFSTKRFAVEAESVVYPGLNQQARELGPDEGPPRVTNNYRSPSARVERTSGLPFGWAAQFLALLVLSSVGAAILQSSFPTTYLPSSLRSLLAPRCTSISIMEPPSVPFQRIRTLQDSTVFNYALKQCGARVLPSLTGSPARSSDAQSNPGPVADIGGLLENTLFDLLGTSPEHAIDGDLQSSQCWEFHGPSGQLGFGLTAMINVSWISVDYDSEEGPMAAPRLMVLWGVVDGHRAINKLKEKEQILLDLRGHLPKEVRQPLPMDKTYIPLAVIEYNPHLAARPQSFSVFREVQSLGFPFAVLVLQVLGNWGGPSTRICHVGVYGEPVIVA